jgi:hypothetical protein
LLIVGSAPAIAVAAGVFAATVVVRSGSAAPAALLLPLTLKCHQTFATATKPAAAGVLPALPPPRCQHCHHASRRRAAATLADTTALLPAAALPPHCHHRHAAAAELPLPRCHRSAPTTAATTLQLLPPPLPLPR